jgi:hypothetical protein
MATYTYQTGHHFEPARFEFGVRSNVIVNTARFTGSVERIELPGSRWVATISYASSPSASAEAAEREAFWQKIRGQTNLVSMWHLFRPTPRGTLRNTPQVASNVAQGATVIPIQGQAGETILPGDMLLASGMLFMVVTALTLNGSGAGNASVTPPARSAITGGASITWDKPAGTFIVTGSEVRVPYGLSEQSPFSVDLVEIW